MATSNKAMAQVTKDMEARMYEVLHDLHDYVNARIYEPEATPLPRPVFMVAPIGRSRYGHFSPGRWYDVRPDKGSLIKSEGGKKVITPDEINIHSELGMARPFINVAATVAHEMAHQAQHHYPVEYGKPGRGTYHNNRWHETCQLCGLSTSGPAGETRVTDAFRDFMRDFPNPERWVARSKTNGSGGTTTRLKKWVCKCKTHVVNSKTGQERPGPYVIRVAGSGLLARCEHCGRFFRPETGEEPGVTK